jgi:secondary thiamine-phosphate synthase enzyme
MIWQKEIILPKFSRGIHLITDIITENIESIPSSGLLNIFVKHTSAAIILNENADPSVRKDLDNFTRHLIPDEFEKFTHIFEGKDDMSAHIKSSIFGQSITIPIVNGKLGLGTWQGIQFCEFRINGGNRRVVLTIYS